jgi:putative phosphotransacetylase
MTESESLTERITELVTRQIREFSKSYYQVPVGISARHIHLTKKDVETLFGQGYRLTPLKPLSQPGQYACKEQLEIIGPKGSIGKVRILGPERPASQVEVSRTDCFKLGVDAPVRTSGKLDGTPGIRLKGPAGTLDLESGVIIADRHIHMTPADAKWFHVSDGERVNVVIDGPKGGVMGQVVVRVSERYRLDFHVDTDDANAFWLAQGQKVTVQKEDVR